MPPRRISTRSSLENLKKQAKTLLDAYRSGDLVAADDFVQFHPQQVQADEAKLTDAQLVLARSYHFPSWPRLQACVQLLNALRDNQMDEVRALVTKYPELLTESTMGAGSSWGAAMSLAANLGRTEIVEMLLGLGAKDLQSAFGRAVLQGKIETARRLLELGARMGRGIVMGPCEALKGEGLRFLVTLGAELVDQYGDPKAPVAMVLETYSRNPDGKHECLRVFDEKGIRLPDTPAMAFHRGRIDLLEEHLQRDPNLLERRFTYDEIYPPEFRVGEDTGLHGTPLHGTTLLHMAVDFDEAEIFNWLLEKGADPNAQAEYFDGFGGHTPLFNGCCSEFT